jgi:fatty-acid desaturase
MDRDGEVAIVWAVQSAHTLSIRCCFPLQQLHRQHSWALLLLLLVVVPALVLLLLLLLLLLVLMLVLMLVLLQLRQRLLTCFLGVGHAAGEQRLEPAQQVTLTLPLPQVTQGNTR